MSDYDILPDAEAAVGWALRDAAIDGLDDRVYSSIPKNATYPLAVVQRIGGIPKVPERVDNPNIQVSVWAISKSDAHDIAQEARVAIFRLRGRVLGVIDDCPVSISVNGVADSLGLGFAPDALTGKDRYIFGVYLTTHSALGISDVPQPPELPPDELVLDGGGP